MAPTQSPKRPVARRKKRRPGAEGRALPPPLAAQTVFDEPATPPAKPNPSIEEAIPPLSSGEPEACGLPDAARTTPADLH
ncbi:MAG: hypothetical protein ACLQJR_06220 [Stellaceae bacterium]